MKRGMLTATMVVLCAGCAGTESSFPPEDRVLAQNTSGGWLNIDFVHTGSPLEEARRCVDDHGDAEAIACFAFASEEDYRATQPIDAGNFRGPLCWDGRWQRNKMGGTSGGRNQARPLSCPSEPMAEEEASTVEDEAETVPTEGPLEVSIDFDIERDSQGRLRISGTTNLPDQTRMSFSLSQEATDYFAQDSGHVQSGRFQSAWFSRQGGPLASGTYEVGVTVPVYNSQPEPVRRRLGSGLEAMTGPLVEEMDLEFLGKVARVSRTIDIS